MGLRSCYGNLNFCIEWEKMESGIEFDGGDEASKGSMWVLEQKLDQSMDEEAGRLKNMYREKVRATISFTPSLN